MSRLYFNMNTGTFGTGAARAKPNPELAKARGRALVTFNKANVLAKAHGIEVDKDSAGGWWVTCPALAGDNDPLDGSHFCATGPEVLEAVEVYVAALAKD